MLHEQSHHAIPDITTIAVGGGKVKFLRFSVILPALLASACASLEGHQLVSSGERYEPAPAATPYLLDVGDVLHVQVYGEATITGDYAVETDGKVDLPLIGRVDALGKSAADVAAQATARYGAGFLKAPSVTAEVRVYRPFFIMGEVALPGQYPFVPGMTINAAVAVAKGYTPRANKKFLFIRRAGSDHEDAYALSASLRIYPGDTIRIGERHF